MTTFNGFEPANTTPVPDTLFDVLLSKLSGAELKVMLYIIRRTLGFKKTNDTISFTQFEKGIITSEGKVLDEGTGLSRETISKALQTLEEKGCIKSDKGYTSQKDKDTTLYSIRFSGDEGVVGKSDHLGSRKNGLPVVGKTDYGSRIIPEGVVGKSDLQETVLQDTVKQETVLQEREVATATARSQTSSQNDLSEETVKREAVKPRTPVQEVTQANTNAITHPPAPSKANVNKSSFPVPKRTKPQNNIMDTLPSEEAIRIMNDWDSLFSRPCARTENHIKAAELLVPCHPTRDDLSNIRKFCYSSNPKWYRDKGVSLQDVAKNFDKWQSLNEAPKPPGKEESNEHKVSSFGTPGFNFADEFYPSEAEKKAYYAAHPIGGKV